MTFDKEATALATEIHCGVGFARDLLTLAGGDAELVRVASSKCDKAEQLKAFIIDGRFRKNRLD